MFRWQERLARNQKGKGVFTDEELKEIQEKSKFRDDWSKLEGLLPQDVEKRYSSFEKFFVAQLDKMFPSKNNLVAASNRPPKSSEKESYRGQNFLQ